MPVFYVYILKCNDGSYYTGHTDNIEIRIHAHDNKLYGGYTSTRLPVKLVFVQQFFSREAAFKSERKIKGWTRKKKEALIKGNWEEIKRLSNEKKNPSTSSG